MRGATWFLVGLCSGVLVVGCGTAGAPDQAEIDALTIEIRELHAGTIEDHETLAAIAADASAAHVARAVEFGVNTAPAEERAALMASSRATRLDQLKTNHAASWRQSATRRNLNGPRSWRGSSVDASDEPVWKR